MNCTSGPQRWCRIFAKPITAMVTPPSAAIANRIAAVAIGDLLVRYDKYTYRIRIFPVARCSGPQAVVKTPVIGVPLIEPATVGQGCGIRFEVVNQREE